MFNVSVIKSNLEAAGFSVFINDEITDKTLIKVIYVATGHSFDIILDHQSKSYEVQGDQEVNLIHNPQDAQRFNIMDLISRAIWGF